MPATSHQPPPGGHQRIALYSHDTQGLGHIRRNSLIAAALVTARPDLSVLLVSGTRHARSLPLPPRTDLAVLPSVAKHPDGRYLAGEGRSGLARVLDLRSRALSGVLGAWAPDLLIVDKVARGVGGELDRVLPRLRDRCGTRTVLGLREVLDDRAATRREWGAAGTTEAIAAHYDEVWVYGDPAVFDPAIEYDWPGSVRERVRWTGYLAHGRDRLLGGPRGEAPDRPGRRPYVLGLVGGGQDGADLARAFAGARYPDGHTGLLITGPFLPDPVAAEIRRTADRRRDLQVRRLVGNVPALARHAAATVSMGGYNSVCEILAAGCPGLVVPRTTPRREQAIRAARMAALGLLDVLPADRLSVPALGDWLHAAAGGPRPSPAIRPALDGLRAIPGLADALLARGGGVGACHGGGRRAG